MVRRALGVVAALGLLVGCTSIPTAGPVMSADISSGVEAGDVDFLPPGPSAGATQDDILAGFIAAGAAAQDNYRVARSYLALATRDTWNPNTSVLVQSGEAVISVESNSLASYVVPVSASIDEFGQYFAGAPNTSQTLDFRFVREEGQWRISSLPDGIVVSEAAFAEAFGSYRLYYFSAGYRELVADVRWFASRGEVSAKIVRALLAPPTFWLDQGATVSAFPEGTGLAVTPLLVVDGVATVDLTTQVLATDTVTRSRMLAQLDASLQQVQGISSAQISVNQVALVIPEGDEEGPTLASGRDPRLVVLTNRRFGYLQGGQVQQIPGLSAAVASMIPESIFYSATDNEALVTREDGLWRVGSVGEPVLLDERLDLVRAIVDSCGYVWSSTQASSADMVRIIDAEGAVSSLPIDIGSESRLVSFELARDDTRLLLLVQTETGVRALLAAVTRDSDCRPESLSEFVELGPLAGVGVDGAWIDDSSVAVVVKDALTQSGEVVVFDTSGRSSSLGRPTKPVALVGGVGGVSGLRLLSEDGIIYQPRGNGWQATNDRASVVATQR